MLINPWQYNLSVFTPEICRASMELYLAFHADMTKSTAQRFTFLILVVLSGNSTNCQRLVTETCLDELSHLSTTDWLKDAPPALICLVRLFIISSLLVPLAGRWQRKPFRPALTTESPGEALDSSPPPHTHTDTSTGICSVCIISTSSPWSCLSEHKGVRPAPHNEDDWVLYKCWDSRAAW